MRFGHFQGLAQAAPLGQSRDGNGQVTAVGITANDRAVVRLAQRVFLLFESLGRFDQQWLTNAGRTRFSFSQPTLQTLRTIDYNGNSFSRGAERSFNARRGKCLLPPASPRGRGKGRRRQHRSATTETVSCLAVSPEEHRDGPAPASPPSLDSSRGSPCGSISETTQLKSR